VQPSPPLQGIARVTSLKVLGVTVNEKLSVMDDVINSYARSRYAISVLRSHGMCEDTRPVRTTSAAGLSVSRHLQAHAARCSGVVGLFDVC